MSITIKGWAQSSKVARTPTRTLRAMLRDRKLSGSKGDDGVWSFSQADLLAIAANGKPIAGAIAAPIPIPITAIDSNAKPVVSANNGQSPVPNGTIPTSLLDAADNARMRAKDPGNVATEDGCEDDEVDEVQQPGCTPLGASSWGGPLFATVASPWSSTVELQRRVAQLEAELAAARSASDGWQQGWARERKNAIANACGIEASMHGAPPLLARDAAAHAVEQLQDTQQLADDVVAVSTARMAATAACQQAAWQQEQAAAWQADADRYRGGDDLAQARRRRGHRMTRSRW